ncbi:hypothetical protein [Falsiroseomonas sp. HW251]|uniref:hypothetical protein n=1 Tax=Falsiroseomonas sp. HW251 TaxID=3390998 RepID=UPI003D320AE8
MSDRPLKSTITGELVPLSDDEFAAWTAEPPPPPVPASVRLLPFLREAAKCGLISAEDALAAARTGTVPAGFEPFVQQLPPDQAFAARLAWAAMVEVERANPLLAFVAAQSGIADASLDDLFRAAGAPQGE